MTRWIGSTSTPCTSRTCSTSATQSARSASSSNSAARRRSSSPPISKNTASRSAAPPATPSTGPRTAAALPSCLSELGLRQPPGRMVTSAEEAAAAADELGFPVLVRPSYVLGGRAMEIVYGHDQLAEYLQRAAAVDPERPVLLDHFLERAVEVDVDAVADGEQGGDLRHPRTHRRGRGPLGRFGCSHAAGESAARDAGRAPPPGPPSGPRPRSARI